MHSLPNPSILGPTAQSEVPLPPFSDPEAAARYAEGPLRQVPGYHALQTMTAILLAERAPATTITQFYAAFTFRGWLAYKA